MADLADDQSRIITVLQLGPSAFPPGLFAGSDDRALLGLKAHANTINHARLVALEETFPRTLARLGLDRFNAMSREFVDQPQSRTRNLMALGTDFPSFLVAQECNVQTVDLARIEWAWLESYHAADARALALPDLSSWDEAQLLAMPLVMHPAVRSIQTTGSLAGEMSELAANGAPINATVLITRPEAVVRMQALEPHSAAILAILQKSDRMRNLLSAAIETCGEAKALPSVFALIEAGVLASPDI